MIAVSDASPLIALLRVRRVDLLREVFGRVVVPDAVWHEIAEAGKDKAGFWLSDDLRKFVTG
jgi:predicted nucleic acid-binding protein